MKYSGIPKNQKQLKATKAHFITAQQFYKKEKLFQMAILEHQINKGNGVIAKKQQDLQKVICTFGIEFSIHLDIKNHSTNPRQ
jgi:hypothetical protein